MLVFLTVMQVTPMAEGAVSEAARSAAWAVIGLALAIGAGAIGVPLLVMLLFRRARARERDETVRPTDTSIDPWVESGRRLMERMDRDDGREEEL
ncbi:MAG: hypothetical protein IIC31_10095 [Chloroflexi bacterium]|nr:hypothetical protein [Chloroflexota bacterium]